MPSRGRRGRGGHARRIADAARRLGYEGLTPAQREAVEALLDGRDVLAVMPTGAGKSAIYQVAGALIRGATVVVSPLVALQRDQVEAIVERAADGEAAELNAALGDGERERRLERFASGDLEYMLLAPEQLARPETLARLRDAAPSLLVVDEAHCVSEWGHDFRPDYLRLGAFAEELGRPRLLALTATAAPPVREEIVERLGMRDPAVLVRGFDRPGIHLAVETFASERARDDALLDAVEAEDGAGIVYVATRRAAEELAGALDDRDVRAAAYHAGLSRGDRDRAQDGFMDGTVRVVVATIAFGMGVDKPDVRFVFHAQPSASVDAYYQEIGRAGRDGAPARAVLFWLPDDLGAQRFKGGVAGIEPAQVERVAERLLETDEPVDPAALRDAADLTASRLTAVVARLEDAGAAEVLPTGEVRATARDRDPAELARAAAGAQDARRAYERSRLDMVRAYAELRDCRRGFILNYFGEPFEGPCGACDMCDAGVQAEAGDEPFPLGARVRHEEWGDGAVQRYEGDRVVVLFDAAGYRTLDVAVVRERGLLAAAGP